MSYGLAVELADEWEQEIRQTLTIHKKVNWDLLENSLDRAAIRSGAGATGLWNHRDIAKKAIQILQERLTK